MTKLEKCSFKEHDILHSIDGYDVVVRKDKDGDFYGVLICKKGHACRDIPYALNNGVGYINLTELAKSYVPKSEVEGLVQVLERALPWVENRNNSSLARPVIDEIKSALAAWEEK